MYACNFFNHLYQIMSCYWLMIITSWDNLGFQVLKKKVLKRRGINSQDRSSTYVIFSHICHAYETIWILSGKKATLKRSPTCTALNTWCTRMLWHHSKPWTYLLIYISIKKLFLYDMFVPKLHLENKYQIIIVTAKLSIEDSTT